MNTSISSDEELRKVFSAGVSAGMAKWAQPHGGGGGGGGFLGKALEAIGKAVGGLPKTYEEMVSLAMKLGGIAVIGGGLAGAGYYSLKKRLAGGDKTAKEMELRDRMAAMYGNKAKELKSIAWITKARKKRDELERNMKNMTTEEYAREYQNLADMFDMKDAGVEEPATESRAPYGVSAGEGV